MKRAKFPLAAVIFVGMAIPDDLPPGVLLHSRVKIHIEQELSRIENISCLETVQRDVQAPRGKMRSLDTVRLEVLFNGDRELLASPNGKKFSEQDPISYVGSGMMGTGTFAGYLKGVLLNNNGSYEYKGEEDIGGQHLARYDYRLPLMWSGQTVTILGATGRVGLHGSYWVDAHTNNVVRLDVIADDIPPTLSMMEMVASIHYAPTSVRDNLTVLLPESAELGMTKFTGEVSQNRIDFTHCRVFTAESKLSFGDAAEETPQFGVSSVDDTLRALPAGLEIAVKLGTRISGEMTVGALIDGVVAHDVRLKHNVLIAAGSPVRGRIRRMERYTDPFPYFVVALEFTEVRVEGIRYRFYANPIDIQPIAGVEQKLWTQDKYETTKFFDATKLTYQSRENLFLYDLPGVVSFFFKASKLELPQGFRTVWKTRPLVP